jgi:putative oxidoreductase
VTDAVAVDVSLVLLRGVVGVVMLAHGWNHIWGGGGIEGTTGWFASLGMRPAKIHAWLASVTELVAGALLVVGFLTPFAAAAVVGTMLVAWITNHADNGFFIFRPGEGWEYVMVLTFAGVAIAGLGPGGWSLDVLLGTWRAAPFGLLVAGAGAAAAALLLAVAWRPDASDDQAGAP